MKAGDMLPYQRMFRENGVKAMRKKLILLVALALALTVMLLLRGKGKHRAEGDEADTPQQAVQNDPAGDAQHTPDPIGAMTANENGGVDITVTAEDGTATVYTFTDVSVDAWYAEAVDYAVSSGVMSGDDAQKLFRPEYGVERSQFAVIIYRFANGEPAVERASFSDLTGDEWYYDYINWMVQQKLMGGVDGGAFQPDEFLSCEQALIVLYRLAGEPEINGTLEDYPYAPKVSESGRDAVTWAWNNGLITEKECVWYPTQAVSRAQVALLLMRYDALIGRNAE